ncbi:hypothetical protein GCM10010840_36350 [Deinococcus aerolatus]|uniref:Carboxypeptidase regulatory-like domain-containing protein n=2 Tax=Deinococcus aerolatus TaxID=522487 RepID=A0ABQ2GH00_9DEIO|nr:hypothetical protein GCM10010840_36350 [Deinococcus aerolatus]
MRQLPLPASGEVTTVLALGPAYDGQALHFKLLGWRAMKGATGEGTPPGWRVTYPSALAAGGEAILPLSVAGPSGAVARDLTLIFQVDGQPGTTIEVLVSWPRVARLEARALPELRTLPGAPLQVPLVIRNTGNVAALASVTAQGADIKALPVSVPPGGEATLTLLVPSVDSERQVRLTVSGGMKDVVMHVRLLGSRPRGAGFGLTVRAGATVSAGDGQAHLDAGVLSIEGLLSPVTSLRASIARTGSEVKPTLSIAHRNTRVDYGGAPTANVAGSVGTGLYLSQEFGPYGPIRRVQVAAALPQDNGTTAARVGLGVSSQFGAATVQARASVSVHGDDPAVAVEGSAGHVSAAVQVTPQRDTRWGVTAGYVTPHLSLRAGAQQREVGLDGWGEARGDVTLGGTPTRFGVRADVRDSAWNSVTLSAQTDHLRLSMRAGADASQWLDARSTFSVGAIRSQLGGSVTLDHWAFRSAQADVKMKTTVRSAQLEAAANAQFTPAGLSGVNYTAAVSAPGGPADLKLSAAGTSAGALDLGIAAVFHGTLPSGQWKVEPNLVVLGVLAAPRTTAGVTASYDTYSGWHGLVGISAPLSGPGSVRVRAGLSYQLFVPTGEALAEQLAGPDPTRRTVRVILQEDGRAIPLAGARVKGCGQDATTDAQGMATLRGFRGSCPVSLDAGSLPDGTTAAIARMDVAPGADQTMAVLPLGQLRGQVTYVDPQSGEVVADGPERQVTVTVSGPVQTFTRAQLPGGHFELPPLPAGTYQLSVEDRPPVTVTLTRAGATVQLQVPGAPRVVLDPSKVTPPVRLAWTSPLVTAGTAAGLQVSSPAQITKVTVSVLGVQTTIPAPSDQSAPWPVGVPTPATVDGLQNVTVEVHFADGSVAHRTLQLVVTPP